MSYFVTILLWGLVIERANDAYYLTDNEGRVVNFVVGSAMTVAALWCSFNVWGM